MQARREDSLAKTSLRGGKAPRGIANDARLGPLITKQENDRRPARLLLSVRRFARSAYFFRRLLITSKAPESRVRALALEPGSISGTAEASAAPDTPTSSKNIPTSFIEETSISDVSVPMTRGNSTAKPAMGRPMECKSLILKDDRPGSSVGILSGTGVYLQRGRRDL